MLIDKFQQPISKWNILAITYNIALTENTRKTLNSEKYMTQPDTDPWYVLVVKSPNERAIEKRLSRMGLEVLVPVQKQVRQWNDRLKVVDQVLFTGYVFVNVPAHRKNDVFKAGRGVMHYLHLDGKPALLNTSEVNLIRRLTEVDTPVHISHYLPSNGDEVEVTAGALAGYKGIITGQPGNKRLHLCIESLNCSAKVDLEEAIVKKL